MKKIACLTVVTALAVALVACGWFLGHRSARSYEDAVSEVFTATTYNNLYADVLLCQSAIEQIDAGRINDAKYVLRLSQDGGIGALDRVVTSHGISPAEVKSLRDLNASLRASNGPMRETANQVIARVARYRAEHPWIYRGNLPDDISAEVQAEVASILKRSGEVQ